MMFIFVFSPMVRGSFSAGQETYTLEKFQEDLKGGNVESVTITPNRDNDTGYAVVTLKDNTRNTLYATQIAVIEQTAREAGVIPVVRDIPSDNLFMVSVLPTILIVVVCLFFFYMMNAQNMGGGSNAKMMNFGKSKARLARNSGVTLDDVAGLQEEKEDRQIYEGRRPHSEGRTSGRRTRHWQNIAGQGRRRRGRRAILQHFGFGFRRNVRRRGRIPREGYV